MWTLFVEALSISLLKQLGQVHQRDGAYNGPLCIAPITYHGAASPWQR